MGTNSATAMQKIIDSMLTAGCEATVASFLFAQVTKRTRGPSMSDSVCGRSIYAQSALNPPFGLRLRTRRGGGT